MDRGAWWAAVHGVTKSQTRLTLTYLLTYSFPAAFRTFQMLRHLHSQHWLRLPCRHTSFRTVSTSWTSQPEGYRAGAHLGQTRHPNQEHVKELGLRLTQYTSHFKCGGRSLYKVLAGDNLASRKTKELVAGIEDCFVVRMGAI